MKLCFANRVVTVAAFCRLGATQERGGRGGGGMNREGIGKEGKGEVVLLLASKIGLPNSVPLALAGFSFLGQQASPQPL